MKRKILAIGFSLILLCSLNEVAWAAEDNLGAEGSATWQDPYNVMLLWDAENNYTYNIYRSNRPNGSYTLIGTSNGGSYRDSDVQWPDAAWYVIEPVSPSGIAQERSAPIEAGIHPHRLSKVTVVMYHNFITEADEAQGVEFEEYSLRPADFEADLQYLRANGYTTITSDDLLDYLNGVKPLPAKAVILSIDDGTEGVYKNAWPLLRTYRAKADFNLIGEQIDAAWDLVDSGGTRVGQSAPYCVWEELIEMETSGEINLCSHTYGLHRFYNDGRTGASMKDNETDAAYANAIREDYDLCVRCIGGWTGTNPTTMAYPYSRRSSRSDELILANTGYQILMGGENARGTESNYFVDGADIDSQLRILSRPCRMEGYPIQTYLDAVDAKDVANGVNVAENPLSLTSEESAEIAQWFSPYADVDGSSWYAGAVYYAYVNELLQGTSYTSFSPHATLSRSMVATLLHRLAGEPEAPDIIFLDASPNDWYAQGAAWCVASGILSADHGMFEPNRVMTREELTLALYQVTEKLGGDVSAAGAGHFQDMSDVSDQAVKAVLWAEAQGILSGDDSGRFLPKEPLTRAQLAAILMRWCALYMQEDVSGSEQLVSLP